MNPIEPYWRVEVPFTVTATATDELSGVASVELWWRYSMDNGRVRPWSEWQPYGVDTNGGDGWSWGFNVPYGYGYYQFYSAATE